jgi:hypothetical protein
VERGVEGLLAPREPLRVGGVTRVLQLLDEFQAAREGYFAGVITGHKVRWAI